MASTHRQQLQHQRIINNNDSPDNNYYDNERRQLLMQYACGTILCVWMTKHSRAWALNNWMTSIPGRKPSTVEWLTFQGVSPQHCMSMNDSMCISAYNTTTTATTMTTTTVPNHLWHTPQLGQHDTTTTTTTEINGMTYIVIFIYIYMYSHSFTFIYDIYYINRVK